MLLAGLLITMGPTAEADRACEGLDMARACVEEVETSSEDACATGGMHERHTAVRARVAGSSIDVYGYAYCAAVDDDASDQHGVAVDAYTPAGYAQAGWVSFGGTYGGERYDACTTWVYAAPTGLVDVGCPAGPPVEPSWGRLLP